MSQWRYPLLTSQVQVPIHAVIMSPVVIASVSQLLQAESGMHNRR